MNQKQHEMWNWVSGKGDNHFDNLKTENVVVNLKCQMPQAPCIRHQACYRKCLIVQLFSIEGKDWMAPSEMGLCDSVDGIIVNVSSRRDFTGEPRTAEFAVADKTT